MTGKGAPVKLDGIEAGRGIAACVVVLYHAARHLDQFGTPLLMSVFQFGHAGVDLFFVISGFIIPYVHYGDIGSPARLGHYLGRRFTRVLPTYWVALAITVLLATAGGHLLPSAADIFWSASLLPSQHPLLLGIAWTLRYEIVFYAAFGLLIINRAVGFSVLALWAIMVLIGLVTEVGLSGVPGPLYGSYNLQFFFGMACAFAVRNCRIPSPKLLLAAGVALFAVAAVAEDVGSLDGYADVARLCYGLPAAMIILGVAETGRSSRLSIPSALRLLGTASYSIYLFQFVFIGIAWKVWLSTGLHQSLPYGVAFVPLAAAGIAGGVLMSRLVEHPLIRIARGGSLSTRPRAALG